MPAVYALPYVQKVSVPLQETACAEQDQVVIDQVIKSMCYG